MSRNGARPKGKGRRIGGGSHTGDQAEARQHRLHRNIADYEEFVQTILPAFRQDVKSGMTPKQLREKYASLAQAKVLSDLFTTQDPKEAIAIAKDLLDRNEGRATEKKEVTHKFKDMSDKELDAILKSEEEDLEAMEERFDN